MKIILILTTVLLFSCTESGGGGGGSAGGASDILTSVTDLSQIQGAWGISASTNTCISSGGRSVITFFDIDGVNYKIVEMGFTREDCSSVPYYVLEANYVGTFSGDRYQANRVSLTMTPESNTGATILNSGVSCGASDWANGVSKDISNTSCDSVPDDIEMDRTQKGSNFFTFVNVDGDTVKVYKFLEKNIFSNWVKVLDSSVGVNLSSLSDNVPGSVTIKSEISQDWIDYLNTNSRDTTGLVAGDTFDCNVTINVNDLGSIYYDLDNIGYVTINAPNVDTPTGNACLEQDNDCDDGACNYDSDHIYYRLGTNLYVDYFGSADSDEYLSEDFR